MTHANLATLADELLEIGNNVATQQRYFSKLASLAARSAVGEAQLTQTNRDLLHSLIAEANEVTTAISEQVKSLAKKAPQNIRSALFHAAILIERGDPAAVGSLCAAAAMNDSSKPAQPQQGRGRPRNPRTAQRAAFWCDNRDMGGPAAEQLYRQGHPDDAEATAEDLRQALRTVNRSGQKRAK